MNTGTLVYTCSRSALLFRIAAASSAMANLTAGLRFSYEEISAYLTEGGYPESFVKADKQVLRKRAKYFLVKDAHLYYVGGLV